MTEVVHIWNRAKRESLFYQRFRKLTSFLGTVLHRTCDNALRSTQSLEVVLETSCRQSGHLVIFSLFEPRLAPKSDRLFLLSCTYKSSVPPYQESFLVILPFPELLVRVGRLTNTSRCVRNSRTSRAAESSIHRAFGCRSGQGCTIEGMANRCRRFPCLDI